MFWTGSLRSHQYDYTRRRKPLPILSVRAWLRDLLGNVTHLFLWSLQRRMPQLLFALQGTTRSQRVNWTS
jgi:hypothetical protein